MPQVSADHATPTCSAFLLRLLPLSEPAVRSATCRAADGGPVKHHAADLGLPADIYVVVDLEADGPVPGLHSMRSLAAVTFRWDASQPVEWLGEWTANLEPLDGAAPHPETLQWWQQRPAQWAALNEQALNPADGIRQFDSWVAGFGPQVTLVAWPATFDHPFIELYLHRFVGHSRLGHGALDLKTLASVALGTPYGHTTKQAALDLTGVSLPHTHDALDDARQHAQLAVRLLQHTHTGRQVHRGQVQS